MAEQWGRFKISCFLPRGKQNGRIGGVEVLGASFNIKVCNDEDATQTTLLIGAAHVQLQNTVSWKNGFFYFGRTSLKEVMLQMARWYDVEVKYEGTAPELELGRKIDRTLPWNELLNLLNTINPSNMRPRSINSIPPFPTG